MLTGMNCPEDLCAIQPEEWSQLILKIAQETEYAAIVLDIGSKLWLADSMFSMCSHAVCASRFRTFGKRSAKTF